MRLHVRALAAASAAAGVLLYCFGAVMDRVSAWGAAAIISFIFRVDIGQLTSALTPASVLTGVVLFALVFAGVGATVAVGYNLLTRSAAHAPSGPGVADAARNQWKTT